MNSYQQTIDYLYNAAPAFTKVGASAYKEGLATTLALDEHSGRPHRKFQTIHVAGTNGKGSCSHSLAAILQAAGFKVGLYTSPHLVTFRERMRVNGEMVSEEYVVRWVEENRAFFEPLKPSFFELTTAMAFQFFADQDVDIAVIEVGLGGRLDCTNIITPILSVITNISFDHTQFLGDTLAKIAAEKAGIMKPCTPVVIGEAQTSCLAKGEQPSCNEYEEKSVKEVFIEKAEEVGAPIIFADDNVLHHDFDFQLKGEYQTKNINTILHAVILLRTKLNIPDEALRKGLASVCDMTGLMGRWQTLSTTPLTICDTGHNLAGWQFLAPQIMSTYADILSRCKTARLHIVFGMVDDKDIDSILALLPQGACYYFCQATTHRAIAAEKVKNLAAHHGLSGMAYPTVSMAYDAAVANSAAEDFIFIGGSSYVVADLLSNISQKSHLYG